MTRHCKLQASADGKAFTCPVCKRIVDAAKYLERGWGPERLHLICGSATPKVTHKRMPSPVQSGVGTELKRLLKKFGIVANAGCKCNQRALLMDKEGPEWCINNLDTIIRWLKEEAQRRHLPFSATAARILVRKAIKEHRQKQFLLEVYHATQNQP